MVTMVDAAAFWLLYHRFKRLMNGHLAPFPVIIGEVLPTVPSVSQERDAVAFFGRTPP